MGAPIRLEIPLVIPSNNQLLRMHWREQRKLSKIWTKEVMIAKCEQLDEIPKAETGRRYISIVSYRRRLIRDNDNLHGGCKPVLDALVNNGLLVDDAEEWVQYDVRQILSDIPRTVIFIYATRAECSSC